MDLNLSSRTQEFSSPEELYSFLAVWGVYFSPGVVIPEAGWRVVDKTGQVMYVDKREENMYQIAFRELEEEDPIVKGVIFVITFQWCRWIWNRLTKKNKNNVKDNEKK